MGRKVEFTHAATVASKLATLYVKYMRYGLVVLVSIIGLSLFPTILAVKVFMVIELCFLAYLLWTAYGFKMAAQKMSLIPDEDEIPESDFVDDVLHYGGCTWKVQSHVDAKETVCILDCRTFTGTQYHKV